MNIQYIHFRYFRRLFHFIDLADAKLMHTLKRAEQKQKQNKN